MVFVGVGGGGGRELQLSNGKEKIKIPTLRERIKEEGEFNKTK